MSDLDDIEMQHRKDVKVVNYCIMTITIIIMLPIVISDLYFGYISDEQCLKHKYTLSMQEYLIVSGYVGLSMILLTILHILSTKYDQIIQFICYYTIFLGLSIFLFVWNLIGIITYFTHIYVKCDNRVTNYLLVIFIIKFIGMSCNCIHNKEH